MKKQLLTLWFLFALSLSLVSCDDAGDDSGKKGGDKGYETAFESDFPNATDVTWSYKNGYRVVGFKDAEIGSIAVVGTTLRSTSETIEKQVWYDEDGNRYLEEDFIDIDDVPAVLVTDFEAKVDINGNSYTVEYKSATRGRYKTSIFYKIYYELSTNTDEFESVGMYYYYDDSDYDLIDFNEDVPEYEIKTELPDFYAMEYIEENYSDYCLGILCETDNAPDVLSDYSANNYVYTVVLYLPNTDENIDLVFKDGTTVGVVVD